VPIDDVGQPSFQRAHGFVGGLAVGLLPVEVGPSFGGVAQLDGGHDVQGAVDLPVPGLGQALADLVAGGGVDRCGAVPGGDVGAVRESGDVGDLDQQPGRAGRADSVQVMSVVPVAATSALSSLPAAFLRW